MAPQLKPSGGPFIIQVHPINLLAHPCPALPLTLTYTPFCHVPFLPELLEGSRHPPIHVCPVTGPEPVRHRPVMIYAVTLNHIVVERLIPRDRLWERMALA